VRGEGHLPPLQNKQQFNFAPKGDYRRGDPHTMVPVLLAGAEVTEAFWAKLAVLS